MSESEVASYVLAYLLRGNYPQTARSFLNECNVLPSKSLLVLPETSLETVIARHKSNSDTRVMVGTLGEGSAWSALWTKLDTTLQQIRCLSEELVALPSTSRGGGGGGGRTRRHRATTAAATPATLSLQRSPVMNSDLSSQQPSIAKTVQSSPHRRKPVPKRKVLNREEESAESAPTAVGDPPSPSMQQVLDTLLGDNSLPGKLADIINQCVSSGPEVNSADGPELLSSDTLDTILSLTASDPALEGLFSQQQASDDVIPPVGGSPPEKRARLDDLPSEQDIDDFLDQLHTH